MRLYRIKKLTIRATVIEKFLCWKCSQEKVGDASLLYDYVCAHDGQAAVDKIRGNPYHYMHWGYSGSSVGGCLTDELDPSKPVTVEDIWISDVHNAPPNIVTLKDRMDASDYLQYCSLYLSPNTTLNDII